MNTFAVVSSLVKSQSAREFAFELVTKSRTYYIAASSSEQFDEWWRALNDTIQFFDELRKSTSSNKVTWSCWSCALSSLITKKAPTTVASLVRQRQIDATKAQLAARTAAK